MIGPGTGVAPFRSLIHDRVQQLGGRGGGGGFGGGEGGGGGGNIDRDNDDCLLYLFFGCRNKERDFYCRQEWEEMEEIGHLRLFTAFSRDGDEKDYVQDRLMDQSELMWKLIIERGASVFVAGNAKRMPEDVWATFRKILVKASGGGGGGGEGGGMTELEAE